MLIGEHPPGVPNRRQKALIDVITTSLLQLSMDETKASVDWQTLLCRFFNTQCANYAHSFMTRHSYVFALKNLHIRRINNFLREFIFYSIFSEEMALGEYILIIVYICQASTQNNMKFPSMVNLHLSRIKLQNVFHLPGYPEASIQRPPYPVNQPQNLIPSLVKFSIEIIADEIPTQMK